MASGEAVEWLGDCHPLAEQLGSAEGLVALSSLSACLTSRPIADLPALRRFLQLYHEQILIPFELPAIETAYTHATHNGLRELIALDQHLAGEPALRDFVSASRRVGQSQLQRLRPLRDDRIVQRYLHAVEAGEAHGWHTLVYGLTLALYSLPLRQGLLGYAWQSTFSFIRAAARPLRLSEADCRSVLEAQCAPLPAAVGKLLGRRLAA